MISCLFINILFAFSAQLERADKVHDAVTAQKKIIADINQYLEKCKNGQINSIIAANGPVNKGGVFVFANKMSQEKEIERVASLLEAAKDTLDECMAGMIPQHLLSKDQLAFPLQVGNVGLVEGQKGVVEKILSSNQMVVNLVHTDYVQAVIGRYDNGQAMAIGAVPKVRNY